MTSANNVFGRPIYSLLALFGQSSDVYVALEHSPYADEHRKRLLDGYAATAIPRYMQAVQKFVSVTSRLGLDIHVLSES